MAAWATVAAALFTAAALFQLGLALGAPWGAAAYGGRAAGPDGRLPTLYRATSALAAVFLAFGGVVALTQGRIITLSGVADSTLTAITWVLAVVMALNTVANLTSTSHLERFGMGSATAALTLCCLVLALD